MPKTKRIMSSGKTKQNGKREAKRMGKVSKASIVGPVMKQSGSKSKSLAKNARHQIQRSPVSNKLQAKHNKKHLVPKPKVTKKVK